jgi:hypothetical protein
MERTTDDPELKLIEKNWKAWYQIAKVGIEGSTG